MKRIFKGTASVVLILIVVLGCVIPTFASMSKTDKFILTNYKQTGDGATDIVNIAMAQEGLTEDVLDYDDSWCAAFISDCAEIAEQSSAIPRNAGVNDLKEAVLKAGGDEIDELKNVKKGDLCFIDWYGDGEGTDFDHVEVVYQDAVGNEVYTIGGNTGKNVDSVYRHDPINSSWHLNNGIILCIVRPNYKNNENIKTGKCGENVTYTFDKSTGTLTISGTGEMWDFINEGTPDINPFIPWQHYKDKIKKVVVEDGITEIGEKSFYFCHNLEEIIIPSSVVNIDYEAFAYSGLKKAVIPNGVKTIEARAFFSCSLVKVTIPKSVTSIGTENFESIWCLNFIEVDSLNDFYSNDKHGVLFNKDKTELIAYPMGKKENNYIIPESVININSQSFNNSYDLINVKLSNNVKKIDEYAFCGSSITTITIPKSVTYIEKGAFAWCDNLTDVYYMGTEVEWQEIKIGSANEDLTDATIHYNYTEKEPTFFEKIISFFDQIISFFLGLFKI